jgi:hypothetical protein
MMQVSPVRDYERRQAAAKLMGSAMPGLLWMPKDAHARAEIILSFRARAGEPSIGNEDWVSAAIRNCVAPEKQAAARAYADSLLSSVDAHEARCTV